MQHSNQAAIHDKISNLSFNGSRSKSKPKDKRNKRDGELGVVLEKICDPSKDLKIEHNPNAEKVPSKAESNSNSGGREPGTEEQKGGLENSIGGSTLPTVAENAPVAEDKDKDKTSQSCDLMQNQPITQVILGY